MKEIPLTQGRVTLVDDDDYEYLSQWKWYFSTEGYAVRHEEGKGTTILMHREIIKTPRDKQTDHINGNGLDNQKKNLRICTGAENQHNARLRKDNTSGFKGVYFYTDARKWRATISINQTRRVLGTFLNKIDAAIAYDVAAKEYFGEFAKTNFKKG